jgi:lactate dehydrogenase-like 2-hydroxyacid dehydrogenase
MKLVFLDTKTVGDVPNIHLFEQFGEVTYYQTTFPDQTLERIQGADIVITNKVVLDRSLLEQVTDLKLICVAATGTNNVDKAAARERGIPVKNVEGYSSHSVAQGTFALLLHLLNQIPYYDEYVRCGAYARSDIFTHFGRPFRELHGKRFGIIGLGKIGLQVAKIAEAFGAEVVYYSASGQSYQQPYPRLELEEFLSTCDIVSIHAPLNEYTHNLLTYDQLQRLKRTAILVNTGRGGIVHEGDLARALEEGLLAGVALDVFEQEPINSSSPLLQVTHRDRLVLTPHVAWASIESRTSLIGKVVQHIREFLKESAPPAMEPAVKPLNQC